MRHRTTAVILLTVFFCSVPEVRAIPQQQPASSELNGPECNWLLSNIGSSRVVEVGQKNLILNSATAQKLDVLRSQMASLGKPGVVVYAPVVAAGSVTMLRMESRSAGQIPLLNAHKTSWNEQTFRTALAAAQQPGGEFFSRDLHRQLIADSSQNDLGKTVFVFDPEAYGLVPRALELKDSVVLASPDLGRAIANLRALENAHPPASEFAAVLGLPSTAKDFNFVFGNSKEFGALSDWQQYNHEAVQVTSTHGIKVLIGSENATIRTKAELLDELQKQAGILFIVAHAEGARIMLSGGKQPIDISPKDISGLNLTRNPFVILRVCQGEDHGFADAFLKAGAIGVWSNRGVIRADVAIDQIRLFLEQLGQNRSTLDAITQVMSRNTTAAASSTVLTELLSNDWGEKIHGSTR
jgi:hypothetical protein